MSAIIDFPREVTDLGWKCNLRGLITIYLLEAEIGNHQQHLSTAKYRAEHGG